MTLNPHDAPRRGLDRGHALFLVGVTVGLLLAVLVGRLARTAGDRDIELLRAVRNLAEADYVDTVDGELLVDDALRGMLGGLDRHSRFYGADEIAHLDRETSGEFRGVGVVFRPPTADGQVLFPFPGSPAARAGIRVGDRIVAIEGETVGDMGPGGLQRALQRGERDELALRVAGLDAALRDVVVRPERIVDPTVRHEELLDEERGIGYLAVLSFSHRTPEEFDAAVRRLRTRGARTLVVDLRANPGGILDAAVRVANRFVEEGPIVATKTRHETVVTNAEPEEALFAGMPLVLLVDEGSASASEVLAGALQDHRCAVLVGEPTYGKGTVQTLTRFDEDRAIVKMTTATYFTPAWRKIERDLRNELSGIMPDVLVAIGDAERNELHRYLVTYSPPPQMLPAIRAWEKDEPGVLPRRPRDVQLEAALDLVRGVRPEPAPVSWASAE